MNVVLWIVQVLAALAFLVAGGTKLFMPMPQLSKRMEWTAQAPVGLVRFIGLAEVLGAIGLILPAATGIAPWLTIAAAIGLGIVMVLAAAFHVRRTELDRIAPTIVLLLLALVIAFGRWKLAAV